MKLKQSDKHQTVDPLYTYKKRSQAFPKGPEIGLN